MNKLYRSLLVAGLAVVGLAGCGDDVTVAPPPPPPPPPPVVITVTVAPNGVTIPVGGTVQLAAAVSGVTGATVTWSSSNASVATVSGTGLVTGVAPGSVGITATATKDGATGQGSATITVSSTQTTPATISINSVTTAAGAPVVLAAAAGQLNVALNLDRGGENVQRVELLLDGTVVGTQNFSLLASKAQEAGEEFDAVEVIVIPFNTAAFDAVTGVAQFLNGAHTLSARVITAENQTGTASPSLSITLANVSFIAITVEVQNGASANSATGILWQTGDIVAVAVPVLYIAGSPAIQQIVLTPTGLNPKTLTAAPFTATWAKGTTVANGGAGSGNGGIEVAGLVVAANSTVGGAVGPVGTSAAINFDTKAPGAPTFVANPNNRQNGWINAAVGLVGLNTSATDNDWLVNGAADAGVGGYIRIIRIGNGPTAADAISKPGETAPALPAPTLTNTTLCAVISAKDLLDNESNRPSGSTTCTAPPVASNTAVAAQHLLFGVDVDSPTIAFSGGLASNARLNGGTVGAEFQVTVADVGTVGNSGMLSGASVIGTVQIRNATGTSCFIGAVVSGVCTNAIINPAPAFPLVPTLTVAGNATVGYYTANLIAQDAAGNMTAPVTRVIVFDPAANVPALTTALFNTPLNGPQVVFNANGSDNLDLRDVSYTMSYGANAVLGGPIQFPLVVLNTFNVAPLVNSNVPAGLTILQFMRRLEGATNGAVGPLTVTAGEVPSQIDGTIRDQANNTFGPVTTAIPGGSVTPGASYTTAAAAQLINTWNVTNAATNVSNGAGPGAAVNPLSVTLNADVFGPTATFNPPFARVDFYTVVAGPLLVQIGSATAVSSTVDDGSANGRRHRYSFTWTPGAAQPVGVAPIIAIGVNAAGDAIATAANNNITVTNP